MAVRVRLRIKSLETGRSVETPALVNSGFEAESPQVLLPQSLARRLGLWPPPPDARLVEVGTAGGPVRNYMVPGAVEVSVVTPDRVRGPVRSDVMISNLEYEVLISDQLGSALGIVILDLRGKWRFSDEGVVRETEGPQYWY
ncbi:MAG: retroviral-like aspartic protease family protein [Desulfurococcales archaeon]|nr:retroviral-like aspartic protease family protein [Desulfurococcales archaeon]